MRKKSFIVAVIYFVLITLLILSVGRFLFSKIFDDGSDYPESALDDSIYNLSGTQYQSQFLETVKVSPDGKLAAVGGWGKVFIWDLASKIEMKVLTTSPELLPLSVRDIAWRPDNKVLAIALKGGRIETWNTTDWTRSKVIDSPYLSYKQPSIVDDSNRLAYTPDQKLIATIIDKDLNLYLWSVENRTLIKNLGKSYGSATFSLDGSLVAALDQSDTNNTIIKVWKTRDGSEIWRNTSIYSRSQPCVSSGNCKLLAINPNNHLLANATNGGTLQVWDINENKLKFSIKAYAFESGNIYFSNDGETLASLSGGGIDSDSIPTDDFIKLWSMQDGEIVKVLQHGGSTDLSFGADRKTLISIDRKTLKYWLYQ